jgi:hypothetical protein
MSPPRPCAGGSRGHARRSKRLWMPEACLREAGASLRRRQASSGLTAESVRRGRCIKQAHVMPGLVPGTRTQKRVALDARHAPGMTPLLFGARALPQTKTCHPRVSGGPGAKHASKASCGVNSLMLRIRISERPDKSALTMRPLLIHTLQSCRTISPSLVVEGRRSGPSAPSDERAALAAGGTNEPSDSRQTGMWDRALGPGSAVPSRGGFRWRS